MWCRWCGSTRMCSLDSSAATRLIGWVLRWVSSGQARSLDLWRSWDGKGLPSDSRWSWLFWSSRSWCAGVRLRSESHSTFDGLRFETRLEVSEHGLFLLTLVGVDESGGVFEFVLEMSSILVEFELFGFSVGWHDVPQVPSSFDQLH